MKNIFATLFLVMLCASAATAQFAFEGGLNMSNLTLKEKGKDIATDYKYVSNFGITLGMPIDEAQHLYFEPGLYFKMGGCKITGKPEGEMRISSIDLPLALIYKTKDKCSARFMVGLGLNISYNMSGTYTMETTDKFQGFYKELKIGSNTRNDLTKRGAGLDISVGYKFKRHLYLRGHYVYGLSNIDAYGDKNNKIIPSSLMLNIGYSLARCSRYKGTYRVYEDKLPNHWRGMSKGMYSRKIKFPWSRM